MRRPILGLAAAAAIVLLVPAGRAHGQAGVGADPFSFYYGYYLPHQAAMAARPTPLDTINNVTAQRQYAAQTDRSALYDPISPYAEDESDPFRSYGGGRRGGGGGGGGPRIQSFTYGKDNSNTRGEGPAMFYNRTARYFPTLRAGRGPNQNLAADRPHRGFSRGGGMGMGMPGMGIR
jgi:hypothetical protein